MLDKVKELIQRPHCYKITFSYESYGAILVNCTVKRPYIKHLAVKCLASNEEEALNKALELLEEVEVLESKIDIIKAPPLDKQKFVDGYYREVLFEDYEVEFKRTFDSYAITRIARKDVNGFYIVKEPYEVTKDHFKVTNNLQGMNVSEYRNMLKEGEELWGWNSIRYLSGSAGLLIVKNDKVIKVKGLMIS